MESLNEDLAKLLLIIGLASEPVGARHIVESLGRQDLYPSESTVARRLRKLDARGLTLQVGTKGRVLTDAGLDLAQSLKRGAISAERLQEASSINTSEDLLNLLRARRAIEPEAVRDATASPQELSGSPLMDLVSRHQAEAGMGAPPRYIALAFHREIARHVKNPMVQAMLDVVLNEDMESIERTLDIILEAHHRGSESVGEHAAIVEAMMRGSAEEAAQRMYEHCNRLLLEVEEFTSSNDGLLNRLLAQSV